MYIIRYKTYYVRSIISLHMFCQGALRSWELLRGKILTDGQAGPCTPTCAAYPGLLNAMFFLYSRHCVYFPSRFGVQDGLPTLESVVGFGWSDLLKYKKQTKALQSIAKQRNSEGQQFIEKLSLVQAPWKASWEQI